MTEGALQSLRFRVLCCLLLLFCPSAAGVVLPLLARV
jgi:hypothetical protein